MKLSLVLVAFIVLLTACGTSEEPTQSPLVGTWELISATSTENDSTYSTFNPKVRMIKIINPTHFSFLSHDLTHGKDTATAAYSAGGGTYTLKDSLYTEHLEYFSNREWEDHKFDFTVKITKDTLVQKGVEKLEKLGIDRVIVETYKKVKNGG
ncbi:MAG: hypothetical protein U0X91_30150 [Spirosomataceae bacterium]